MAGEISTRQYSGNPSLLLEREHDVDVSAKRVIQVPLNMRSKLDYDVRTDGQPVYLGYIGRGNDTANEGWLILKHTYSGEGYVTDIDIAYGSWDNRASLSYT